MSQTPVDAGSALRELIIGAQGEEGDQPLLAPAVARLMVTATGTIPLASGSSGFTYAFDPGLGIPVLTTRSFGPTFIERPETAGRGRWAFGFTAQHTNWQSIDGFNLKNGDLHTSPIFSEDHPDFFQSFIDLSTTITAFTLSRGITDRLDVGASVPFVTQSVSGRNISPPGFGNKPSVEGRSSGVGDIGLHAKFNIVRRSEIGLSTAAEIKLPTGDQAKLLGTGKAAYRVLVIASARSGIVASHLNIGYTAAGHGFPADLSGFKFAQSSIDAAIASLQPSNEINYAGGADVAVASRVTVSAEVVGRSLQNSAQVAQINPTFLELVNRPTELVLVGTAGVKVNVASRWLLVANVIFPLSDVGLKPGVTPVLGFERAF